MTSIFSNTRFASMTGAPAPAKQGIYEDDVPVESVKSKYSKGGNTFLMIWLAAGFMTVAIPFIGRNARMNNYQNNALQKGLDQWNQFWNNVSNGNNNGQYQQEDQNQQDQGQEQEGRQFYDVSNCKWYSFNCEAIYVDQDGEYVSEWEMQEELYNQQMEQQQQDQEQQQEYYQQQQEYQQQQQEYQYQGYQQQQQQAGNYNQAAYGQYYQNSNGEPDWYYNFGQTEEERENATEWGKPSGYLKFVYVWQLAMFVGILAYGGKVIVQGKSPALLLGMLMIWFQFNFLSMFMLSDGSIITEDRVIQRTGFYGQFAVLMFMTNAWYAAFGLLFLIVFSIRAQADKDSHSEETAKSGELNKTYDSPEIDEYVKVV